MTKIVVSDTGPLIALALIDLIPILPHLFSEVYIPDAVAGEATNDLGKPGARAITAALDDGILQRRLIKLNREFEELSQLLDRGEAEAIALAAELGAIALIDERRGRTVAASRGIEVVGTAAILVKAKSTGHIDFVDPYLDKLSQAGYRLSDKLIGAVLKNCGE